jgi:hypothetical protein
MRRVLTLVLVLSVAGCGPAMRWEKPGADEKATADDLVGCRRAAQDESMREFPFHYPWGFPLSRRPFYWQRSEIDRFYFENRLTSFCMRSKGYALVPVAPAPQTQPPPPPSPERDAR